WGKCLNSTGCRASTLSGLRPRLLRQLPEVSPADQDHVIVVQGLPELRAGNDVIVALAPRRAIVRTVHGDRLKFRVVIGEVNKQFGEAGLQVPDNAEVEILPARGGHVRESYLNRIGHYVFVGKKMSGFRSACCKKWELVFASDFYV